MTRLTSYQNTSRSSKIASAALPIAVFETMIRCAELQGYESVSDFVKDSILAKCEDTAYQMIGVVKDNKAMVAS